MSRTAHWASLVVVCLVSNCGGTPEPPEPTDADLRAAVMVALALDAETRPLQLDIISRDGGVQLVGFTTTLAQQQHALTVAASVPGIRATGDNMTLSEAVRTDIKQQVEASLSTAPELAGVSIQVSVGDGIVTLRSDDTDRDQRDVAVRIAGSHDNVIDVVDHMR